jgi:hypothetical protein
MKLSLTCDGVRPLGRGVGTHTVPRTRRHEGIHALSTGVPACIQGLGSHPDSSVMAPLTARRG